MTDEEMAEQFADNISGLELTCSLLSAKDKSHAYRLGRYDGFLAGLKAGRPQWHDLRKDPNDLPKKELWNKQLLLLVDRNGLTPCFVVGYYEESEVLEDYEKNWGWYNIAENVAYDFIDNEISVLKWKEIE